MANSLPSLGAQVLMKDLPNDAMAREVADKLAEQFGQTIVVTDEDGNIIYVAKMRPH